MDCGHSIIDQRSKIDDNPAVTSLAPWLMVGTLTVSQHNKN